jgi:hypothetical protein
MKRDARVFAQRRRCRAGSRRYGVRQKQGGNRSVLIRSPKPQDIRAWLPYICVEGRLAALWRSAGEAPSRGQSKGGHDG